MSNSITVQDFYLLDQDSNLPTEQSVVAVFKDVVSSDGDALTIQQLLIDNDIKAKIEAHNSKRKELVNKGILERTGNKVKLEGISIKNLTWLAK
jgi:hypothetical protein